MPAKTPRATVAAYVARLRRTIQCVARAGVFGSGHALDRVYNITVVPRGGSGSAGDTGPLRTVNGHGDVYLAIAETYRIVSLPPVSARSTYQVHLAYYEYAILDRDDRELLAYHWHPEGVSDITFPHLHIPRVRPLSLPRSDPPRAVAVGDMHLPTNHVHLEDVVELLIREFGIAPLRADWQAALAKGRSAREREG